MRLGSGENQKEDCSDHGLFGMRVCACVALRGWTRAGPLRQIGGSGPCAAGMMFCRLGYMSRC